MNSISWPEVLQNRKKSLGIFQFILRLGKCCKSQRAGPGESRKACQNGKCDLPSSVGFEAIKVGRKPGPFYKQWTKNSKGSKQESSKWGTLIRSPGRVSPKKSQVQKEEEGCATGCARRKHGDLWTHCQEHRNKLQSPVVSIFHTQHLRPQGYDGLWVQSSLLHTVTQSRTCQNIWRTWASTCIAWFSFLVVITWDRSQQEMGQVPNLAHCLFLK